MKLWQLQGSPKANKLSKNNNDLQSVIFSSYSTSSSPTSTISSSSSSSSSTPIISSSSSYCLSSPPQLHLPFLIPLCFPSFSYFPLGLVWIFFPLNAPPSFRYLSVWLSGCCSVYLIVCTTIFPGLLNLSICSSGCQIHTSFLL